MLGSLSPQSQFSKSLSLLYTQNQDSLEAMWQDNEGGGVHEDDSSSVWVAFDPDVEGDESWAGSAGLNMCDLVWDPVPSEIIDKVAGRIRGMCHAYDAIGFCMLPGMEGGSSEPVPLSPWHSIGNHRAVYTLPESYRAVISLIEGDMMELPEHIESHLHLRVPDAESPILPEVLTHIHEYAINAHDRQSPLYIHCIAGVNRTAVAAAVVLMTCYRLSLRMAVQYIRAKRRCTILLNATFRRELTTFEKILTETIEEGLADPSCVSFDWDEGALQG